MFPPTQQQIDNFNKVIVSQFGETTKRANKKMFEIMNEPDMWNKNNEQIWARFKQAYPNSEKSARTHLAQKLSKFILWMFWCRLNQDNVDCPEFNDDNRGAIIALCESRVDYADDFKRYNYWRKVQKDNNNLQKIERNDKLKHEFVPYIPPLIETVKNSNLKNNDKLLVLLYLNGACVRSDVATLRCDGDISRNYVDFANKRLVYQYVTKNNKTKKVHIVIDDLDESIWKLIEERQSEKRLIEKFTRWKPKNIGGGVS